MPRLNHLRCIFHPPEGTDDDLVITRPISRKKNVLWMIIMYLISLYCLIDFADAKAKSRDQVPACGADQYEPNNLRARARNLSFELKNAREITAHLCRQDQDWYTVWLNQGELVEFHVVTPLETPPQIKVFAPRKRKPKGIARRLSPDHRQLRIYAQRSGRYRILISGGQDARTRYQLYLHRPSPTGPRRLPH